MTDDIARASLVTASGAEDGLSGLSATAGAPFRQQLPASVTTVKMAKQLYQNGGSGGHYPHTQTPASSLRSNDKERRCKSKGRQTFNIRHQHMIRLIGQFLSRCGLDDTVNNLMRESGLQVEEDIACRLRQSIMTGNWQEAEKQLLTLKPFIVVVGNQSGTLKSRSESASQAQTTPERMQPTALKFDISSGDSRENDDLVTKAVQQEMLLKKMYFLVRERKFLELLEAAQILDALLVLRNEIGTLNVNVERMHELAMCLMMPITTPQPPPGPRAAAANGVSLNTNADRSTTRIKRHARYRTAAASSNGNATVRNGSSAADRGSLTSTDATSDEGETEVDGLMLDGEEDGGGDAARFYRGSMQMDGTSHQSNKHLKAREALINALQIFLPPGIMLPPDRLEVLIDQAVAYQMQRCTLHDCAFMAHDDDIDNARSSAVLNGGSHRARHGAVAGGGGGSRSTMWRRPGIRRSATNNVANGHNIDQILNGSVPDGSRHQHYEPLPQSATQAEAAITSVDDEEVDDKDDSSNDDDAGSRYIGNESKSRQPSPRSGSRFSRSCGLLSDHVCNEADFPSTCIQTLRDHTDEVWFVRFSHNGKYLASASRDGRVLIYAVDLHVTLTARRLYTFDVSRDSNTAVSAIAFLAWSPDDRFLAGCGQESNASNVLIWNMEHGTLHSRINRTAEDALTCVAWRKCSRRLVAGGMRGQFYYSDLDGNSLGAWDGIRVQALAYGGVGLGRFLQPLRRSDSSGLVVDGAAAVDDAPLPVDPGYGMGHSAGGNDTVLARNDAAAVGSAEAAEGSAVGLSDCYVLAADTHYRVRVYNLDAVPRPLDAGLIQEDHPIISFSCNSSGRWALLNVQDQSLRVWDLYDRTLVRKYRGVQEGKFTVHSCFGGSREQFIVSGSEDRHVYIWHIDNSEPVQVLRAHTASVGCVHWNKAQPMLIASASDDHTVRLWAPRRFVDGDAANAAQQSGDEPMLADESMMPSASSDSVGGGRGGSGDAGSTLPPPPAAAGGGAGSRFSVSSLYSGSGGGSGGSRSIGHLFRRGLLGSSHVIGSGAAGPSDLPLLFVPNDSMASGQNSGAGDSATTAVGSYGSNMPFADSGSAALVAAGFSGTGGSNPNEQQQGGGDAGGAFPDLRTPSSMFHRVITPTLASANTRRNNAALARDLAALNAAVAASSTSGSGRGGGSLQQQPDGYHLYPGGSTSGSGRGNSTAPTFPNSASRLLQIAFQQHEAASTDSRQQQLQQQQQQLLQEQSAAWAASVLPPLDSGSDTAGPESGTSSSMMATLQNIVMAQRSAEAAASRRSASSGAGHPTSNSSSLAAPFSHRYQQLLAAAAGGGSDSRSGVPPSIRFREAFGGERLGGSGSSNQAGSNEAVSAALSNILGSVESAAATGSSGSSLAQRYAASLQSSADNNPETSGGGTLDFSLLNASSLSSGSAAHEQHASGASLMLDDDDDEDDESHHGPANSSTSALFGHAVSAAAAANAAEDEDDDDDDDTDEEGDNDGDAMHDANLDYEDDGDDDDEDDEDEDADEAANPVIIFDSNASGNAAAQPTTPTAPPPTSFSAGVARRTAGRGAGDDRAGGGTTSQQLRDDRARR